jgi:uncharacterized RDD family membrane protein YckC
MSAAAAAPYAPSYQPTYGGFVQRFAALWIDNLVIAAITGALLGTMWVTGILLGYLVASEGGSIFAGIGMLFLSVPLAILTTVVYHIKFETGPNQATIGKRLLGMKLVNMQGGTISAGQSLGRLLSQVFLSTMFFSIGYWLALFTDKKQALHDLVASTLVVRQ